MFGNSDKYEDEEWCSASKIVLAEERIERNNPRWAPTLLNGSFAYSERVAAKCEELRGNGIAAEYDPNRMEKMIEEVKTAKVRKVWNG
jgi:hypothetical protein